MLIPDLDAGCSLADSITPEQLRAWQAQHPGAVTVMYVNTTAEIKALTDYCVTSSNAVQVVEHILREHGEDTEILFGPDMFLGAYVEKSIGRALHVWDGECHVHAGIRPADIDARARPSTPAPTSSSTPSAAARPRSWSTSPPATSTPRACTCSRRAGCSSTPARRRPGRTAIMATETGMLHPLRMAAPDVDFIAANEAATCRYMKMITLPKLRDCLRDLTRRGEGARGRRRARPRADRAHGRHRVTTPRGRRRSNTFAGGALDRAGPALATRSGSPRAAPTRRRARSPRAPRACSCARTATRWCPRSCAAAELGDGVETVLLGVDARGAVFGVDAGALGRRARAAARARRRACAACATSRPALSPGRRRAAGPCGRAAALAPRDPHCSRCGAPRELTEAGYSRALPAPAGGAPPAHRPGRDHARRRRRPGAAGPPGRAGRPGAGRPSPGSSSRARAWRRRSRARSARRPTWRSTRSRYVSSQPWPFPASLMLGFEAALRRRRGARRRRRARGRALVLARPSWRHARREAGACSCRRARRSPAGSWTAGSTRRRGRPSTRVPGRFAVARLEPDAPSCPPGCRPRGVRQRHPHADELSVTCPQDAVPAGVPAQRDLAALRVEGPLDFGLTGVLAALSAPLAGRRHPGLRRGDLRHGLPARAGAARRRRSAGRRVAGQP